MPDKDKKICPTMSFRDKTGGSVICFKEKCQRWWMCKEPEKEKEESQ